MHDDERSPIERAERVARSTGTWDAPRKVERLARDEGMDPGQAHLVAVVVEQATVSARRAWLFAGLFAIYGLITTALLLGRSLDLSGFGIDATTHAETADDADEGSATTP